MVHCEYKSDKSDKSSDKSRCAAGLRANGVFMARDSRSLRANAHSCGNWVDRTGLESMSQSNGSRLDHLDCCYSSVPRTNKCLEQLSFCLDV